MKKKRNRNAHPKSRKKNTLGICNMEYNENDRKKNERKKRAMNKFLKTELR